MKKLLNGAGKFVIAGVLFFIIAGIVWDEPLAIWIGGIVGAVFLGFGYATRND